MSNDRSKKNIIKGELADAARRGIREFLSSTRGAAICGAESRIDSVDARSFNVRVGDQQAGGGTYFTVSVKEML